MTIVVSSFIAVLSRQDLSMLLSSARESSDAVLILRVRKRTANGWCSSRSLSDRATLCTAVSGRVVSPPDHAGTQCTHAALVPTWLRWFGLGHSWAPSLVAPATAWLRQYLRQNSPRRTPLLVLPRETSQISDLLPARNWLTWPTLC